MKAHLIRGAYVTGIHHTHEPTTHQRSACGVLKAHLIRGAYVATWVRHYDAGNLRTHVMLGPFSEVLRDSGVAYAFEAVFQRALVLTTA